MQALHAGRGRRKLSVIEMEIKEHAIYKTCEEHDPGKYVAIASQSSGYAKLCCYAVKKLNQDILILNCLKEGRSFGKENTYLGVVSNIKIWIDFRESII